MAFRAFKKIAQATFEASKAQDNNEQFSNQFRNNPLLDGVRITNVTVITSTVSVAHRLGRQPLGYIITKQSADARIWLTSWNDRFLVLDSSATVVIDLWVF